MGVAISTDNPATFDVALDTSVYNQVSNHFFHDGTERPIRRLKDPQVQKAYYSGKKKQHTIKNNLVINAACKVVLLTPSFEGRIHDKQIADAVGYTVPSGSDLYQDSGFQGFTRPGINIIQPKKKPKGGELTPRKRIVLFRPYAYKLNRRLAVSKDIAL